MLQRSDCSTLPFGRHFDGGRLRHGHALRAQRSDDTDIRESFGGLLLVLQHMMANEKFGSEKISACARVDQNAEVMA